MTDPGLHSWNPPASLPVEPSPSRRRRWWIPAAIALSALLVFAAGWYGGTTYEQRESRKPDSAAGGVAALASAQGACDNLHHGSAVADNGHTLTVDTQGKEDAIGASTNELGCILDHLSVPDAVRTHMEQTRALDGRQQDSWGAFNASWIYHPDNGLELIVRTS